MELEAPGVSQWSSGRVGWTTLWENTHARCSWVLLVCHPRLPSRNTPQSECGVDYFQPAAITLHCAERIADYDSSAVCP